MLPLKQDTCTRSRRPNSGHLSSTQQDAILFKPVSRLLALTACYHPSSPHPLPHRALSNLRMNTRCFCHTKSQQPSLLLLPLPPLLLLPRRPLLLRLLLRLPPLRRRRVNSLNSVPPRPWPALDRVNRLLANYPASVPVIVARQSCRASVEARAAVAASAQAALPTTAVATATTLVLFRARRSPHSRTRRFLRSPQPSWPRPQKTPSMRSSSSARRQATSQPGASPSSICPRIRAQPLIHKSSDSG